MSFSSDRDESRDRELVLKHQPSISDSGRASVPMYARHLDRIIDERADSSARTSQVGQL